MNKKLAYILVMIICLISCSNKQADQNTDSISQKDRVKDTISVLNQMGLGDSISDQKTFENLDLYVLDTLIVYHQKIFLQSSTSILQTNGKEIFKRDYDISLSTKSGYSLIKIQSLIGTDSYEIYIRKNKNNQLEIFKETGWSDIVTRVEIAKDDYDSYRANLICTRESIKPITKIIKIPEDLNFNEDNKIDCFICPQQYSTDECLYKKQKGEPFTWE